MVERFFGNVSRVAGTAGDRRDPPRRSRRGTKVIVEVTGPCPANGRSRSGCPSCFFVRFVVRPALAQHRRRRGCSPRAGQARPLQWPGSGTVGRRAKAWCFMVFYGGPPVGDQQFQWLGEPRNSGTGRRAAGFHGGAYPVRVGSLLSTMSNSATARTGGMADMAADSPICQWAYAPEGLRRTDGDGGGARG